MTTFDIIQILVSERLNTAALLGSKNPIVKRIAWEKRVKEECDVR
jgi:hypothetical protein